MKITEFFSSTNDQAKQEERILSLIEMAGWKGDPRILAQVRLAQRSGNWSSLQTILQLRFKDAVNLHPLRNVPSAEDVSGEIVIGNLVLPDWTLGFPVAIPIHDLNTHAQIIGPTGVGKSVLSRFVIIQLNNHGVPVWVFDTEDQFKNVVAYAVPGSFLVIDVSKGEWKRNVWQPLSGETFMDVDGRMRDVLRQKWVGEGGTGIESEVAMELHAEHGLFTMRQFYERVKKYRNKTRDWTQLRYIAGLLNRITDLNLQLAHTYEVLEGYDIEDMMNRSIVFRMSNLSADNVFFFVVELLSAVSDIRRQERDDYLPLAILLDEAQRFFKPADQSGTAIYPLMLDHFQTFRKRNIYLISATQDIFDVPKAVSTNVGASVYFRPLDGESNAKIAKSLSLTPEQTKFLSSEMPKRHVIMRHPNFLKPILIRIPELDLEQKVTEEQIMEMMAPILSSLKWKPSPFANGVNGRETVKANPIEHDMASDDTDYAVDNESENRIKDEAKDLDIRLIDYIRAIADDQFVPSTIRDEKLNLSAGKGFARRSELLKLGLIEEVKVPTGVRGGQVTLLDITSAGRDLLARHHIKLNAKGKGGLKHQYFQNVMQRWFAKHYTAGEATIEDVTSGKAVDVSFVDEEKKIAVEILVNGIDKELSNIEADIQSFDEIWLVAESKEQSDKLAEKVRASFYADEMNRIRFELIGKFISELGGNENKDKNKKSKQHK